MSDLLICVERTDLPAEIPNPSLLPESSPVVLCGPIETLKIDRIALLNSRQSPRFSSSSAWIEKTLEALHGFDPVNTTIVSSLNTTSWDFLTWAASKRGFPVVLVFPGGSAQNFNIYRTKAVIDLDLDEQRTLALKPLIVGRKRKTTEAYALRDRWIMALSNRLVPVSVRPKGNFERYLRESTPDKGAMDRRFAIPYETAKPLEKAIVAEDVPLPSWYKPRDYLIHWTRSSHGPWPDETKADYFKRLMESGEEPTGGFDTLVRIVRGGAIRASGRLIKGGYPVVPFTARPPQDLHKLLAWRPGLHRWTFEPCGIAIRKSLLIEAGARPVQYGDLGNYEMLSENDRPFFQIIGSGKRDWRVEKEWRIKGDVSFKSLKGEDFVILVYDQEEAAKLKTEHTFPIILLKP
jgi:hypothetical protein